MHTPRLPDFLIIGAARSGTTTLHSWLLEHPDVYVPKKKTPEPHFFLKSQEYGRGLDYYRSRWFGDRNGQLVAGEASTSYLFQPWVPPRIREHLPDCRFVVMLRNPIERAYSSYWFTRGNGLESLSFDEAIQREPERTAHADGPVWQEIQPHAYAGRGMYATQLERYFGLFPRERFFIAQYEELEQRPLELARRLYRFLGVDDTVRPADPGRAHNATARDKPAMSDETRGFLRDAFHEEIRRLEAILGRDLSDWER